MKASDRSTPFARLTAASLSVLLLASTPGALAADENAAVQPAADGNAAEQPAAQPPAAAATTASALAVDSQSAPNQISSSSNKLEPFQAPRLSEDMPLLRGQVSTFKGRSPLLHGSVQAIPEGTKIELIIPDGININSEVSQKGDEVIVRIAKDIMDGDRVLVPGGWYMRGLVTDSVSRKRLGRNGYVDVQFDKMVSPDGDYEVDFNAKFSTKDHKLVSIAKIVAKDTAIVSAGAGAGALIAFQFTGIAGTIASQGYNIAGGAAIGGAIGLFGALKRKGKVASIYAGDVLKLTTSEALMVPGFDKTLLPSGQPVAHLEGLDLRIKDYRFVKPWWNDRSAKLLEVDIEVDNHTNQSFHFFDLQVISDHDQRYMPLPVGGFKNERVAPGKSGAGKVVFTVGSPKRKYSLIFMSRRTGKELSRASIN